MGGIVKFIPYTIIMGFTTGVAATIAFSQIGVCLDFTIGKMAGEFVS